MPYPDEELREVLIAAKAAMHPWIRLNRVVRDIPSQYIVGGLDVPNLRQARSAAGPWHAPRSGPTAGTPACACACNRSGWRLSLPAPGD